MSRFDAPVRVWATSPVVTLPLDAPASEVWEVLEDHRFSAIPLVTEDEQVQGLVSRVDLLRQGTLHYPHEGPRRPTLELPDATAAQLASGQLIDVEPSTPVREAAKRMVETGTHRVLVTELGKLRGILTTRDLMQVVFDARIETPITEIMSSPVMGLASDATLSSAIDVLSTGAVSGVVIEERGWPVGVMTQQEALVARHFAPETKVDVVMGQDLIALPPDTPLHRAAGHACSMHVRRIVILGVEGMRGIVSGLDFARVVADS